MLDKPTTATIEKPAVSSTSVWVWLALAAAVVASAGSLALTLYEQKQPCPLCFYQRTFALSLVAILGQGLLTSSVRSGRLAILALSLVIGGLGVAAFHVSLEVRGILECPTGLYGVATAPQQSLAIFAVITILLGAGVVNGVRTGEVGALGTILALVLGGILVWSSISANPKPPTPTKPYETPLTVCRPPYHAAEPK